MQNFKVTIIDDDDDDDQHVFRRGILCYIYVAMVVFRIIFCFSLIHNTFFCLLVPCSAVCFNFFHSFIHSQTEIKCISRVSFFVFWSWWWWWWRWSEVGRFISWLIVVVVSLVCSSSSSSSSVITIIGTFLSFLMIKKIIFDLRLLAKQKFLSSLFLASSWLNICERYKIDKEFLFFEGKKRHPKMNQLVIDQFSRSLSHTQRATVHEHHYDQEWEKQKW